VTRHNPSRYPVESQPPKLRRVGTRPSQIDEVAIGFRRYRRIRQPRTDRLSDIQRRRTLRHFLLAPIRNLDVNVVCHAVYGSGERGVKRAKGLYLSGKIRLHPGGAGKPERGSVRARSGGVVIESSIAGRHQFQLNTLMFTLFELNRFAQRLVCVNKFRVEQIGLVWVFVNRKQPKLARI
jgi:hypothetical protein